MPRIRDKSLQSGRIGSMLNGLAEFDQTDWSGDYEPLTSGEWTGGAIYSDFIPDTPSESGLSDELSAGAPIPFSTYGDGLSAELSAGSPVVIATSPNILKDFLSFGSALLKPPQTQQQRIAIAKQAQRTQLNMPLLFAAGLAAFFIATRK